MAMVRRDVRSLLNAIILKAVLRIWSCVLRSNGGGRPSVMVGGAHCLSVLLLVAQAARWSVSVQCQRDSGFRRKC